MSRTDPPERVRIPADVEREDRILAGLTARQLGILAAAGFMLWLGFTATRGFVTLPVFAAFAAPAGGAAVAVAVGRWHGLSADRLLAAMARQRLGPRRLVPAPDGLPTPLTSSADAGVRLGALGLPIVAIGDDGTLDLGENGTALLTQATAVSFALRTPAEREALAGGFGRYLNGLANPIQILLNAEPVDLRPVIDELQAAAPGLPHPRLEAACRDHADYLSAFAASRPLLRREVLLILRDPNPTIPGTKHSRGRTKPEPPEAAASQTTMGRLAADAAAALGGSGVTLTVLDGPAASVRLARSLSPDAAHRQAGRALPNAVITGGRP
jgi:PrgI family protein